MTSSKGVAICSGLCVLGISAAVAYYNRKTLLSRFWNRGVVTHEEPTKEEETPAVKTDPETENSRLNVSDSDSFFSVDSECKDSPELADFSSSDDCQETTKRNTVLKTGFKKPETSLAEAMKGLADQLSSPIVTPLDFQRTHSNHRNVDTPQSQVYNDVITNEFIYEEATPSTSQPTSYRRLYEGYHSIVTPNSSAAMMLLENVQNKT